MMKVLFAAAEAVPFAKAGGLGDVIGSLPKQLRKQGIDARVILPKYQDIPDQYKQQMVLNAEVIVPVGWRQQYCGIQQFEYDGVPFYFIDNEYYFERQGLYGHDDDGERFAFFSRAVLEALAVIDFIPDVLHCHDWHTGMVSVLLDAHYRHLAEYKKIKTLFTIHNLRYQGIFPKEVLHDLLDLGEQYFTSNGVEFNNQINFMKGGLVYSNMISTVSRTYAEEIRDPYYGEQLDGLIRKRQDDLVGIINGIDDDAYNPATDKKIFKNYDVSLLTGKLNNKLKLQQRLGLPVGEEATVVAIVSRLVGPKGIDLVECILEDMIKSASGNEHNSMQFVVVGTGEDRYENFFKYLASQYPDNVSANILFDDVLARQVYAGADVFLMPSLYEPCGIGQLIAMRYGCLPVVRETGGLKDTVKPYNKYTGEGNGFTFTNYNAHEMLDAINRAIECFHDKKVWVSLIRNAMQSDYSWQQSARQYHEIYNKLVE